jgi:hypothetical protein
MKLEDRSAVITGDAVMVTGSPSRWMGALAASLMLREAPLLPGPASADRGACA